MIPYPHFFIGQVLRDMEAIYFYNENHVIHDSIVYLERSIVFISEKTSNSPFFRLTCTPFDKETIRVKFEMYPEGDKIMTCTERKCKKK